MPPEQEDSIVNNHAGLVAVSPTMLAVAGRPRAPLHRLAAGRWLLCGLSGRRGGGRPPPRAAGCYTLAGELGWIATLLVAGRLQAAAAVQWLLLSGRLRFRWDPYCDHVKEGVNPSLYRNERVRATMRLLGPTCVGQTERVPKIGNLFPVPQS
jgi:hypothetical protein